MYMYMCIYIYAIDCIYQSINIIIITYIRIYIHLNSNINYNIYISN